jgi:hypothetical protein
MAYINQETKAKIVNETKVLLKKYNMKATWSIKDHAVLKLNVKTSNVDFISDKIAYLETRHDDISESYLKYFKDGGYLNSNTSIRGNLLFTGKSEEFLTELAKIIYSAENNHDNSDSQTDYFDVGFYFYVNLSEVKYISQ